MKNVTIHDKEFELFITYEKIRSIVEEMAEKMNHDLKDKNPLFLCILNGSFMFAAEVFKRISLLDAEISFIKLASYSGTHTTGNVKQLIGLNEDLTGRTVIILEDIVDSGITIANTIEQIKAKNPADIKIATLLLKPESLQVKVQLDYIGLEIPNDFIVGYGLDYDGRGRNLIDIYKVTEKKVTQNQMLNLVLFGPPGAGKGTQADFLIEKFKLIHLSTGDLLRSQIAAETALGLEAKSYMDKGFLVPDSIVIGMIKSKLQENKEANGFIFDGFPRTTEQANALDELLDKNETPVSGMLCLMVEKDELIKRLLFRGKTSGRPDDQDVSIIENRINVYHEKTSPLRDYYRAQNKYYKIDGTGSIEEIAQRLIDTVSTL